MPTRRYGPGTLLARADNATGESKKELLRKVACHYNIRSAEDVQLLTEENLKKIGDAFCTSGAKVRRRTIKEDGEDVEILVREVSDDVKRKRETANQRNKTYTLMRLFVLSFGYNSVPAKGKPKPESRALARSSKDSERDVFIRRAIRSYYSNVSNFNEDPSRAVSEWPNVGENVGADSTWPAAWLSGGCNMNLVPALKTTIEEYNKLTSWKARGNFLWEKIEARVNALRKKDQKYVKGILTPDSRKNMKEYLQGKGGKRVKNLSASEKSEYAKLNKHRAVSSTGRRNTIRALSSEQKKRKQNLLRGRKPSELEGDERKKYNNLLKRIRWENMSEDQKARVRAQKNASKHKHKLTNPKKTSRKPREHTAKYSKAEKCLRHCVVLLLRARGFKVTTTKNRFEFSVDFINSDKMTSTVCHNSNLLLRYLKTMKTIQWSHEPNQVNIVLKRNNGDVPNSLKDIQKSYASTVLAATSLIGECVSTIKQVRDLYECNKYDKTRRKATREKRKATKRAKNGDSRKNAALSLLAFKQKSKSPAKAKTPPNEAAMSLLALASHKARPSKKVQGKQSRALDKAIDSIPDDEIELDYE